MKRISTAVITSLVVMLFVATQANAQLSIFKSSQVGSSPSNGYILSTDGVNSTWIANTGGAGGGSETIWSWNSSTNITDADGPSTTPTTTVRANNFFGTSTSIASVFRLLTATSATTTNLRTTQLGVGSDYITDLTGTGLSIVGNALTATNDHVAVTVSGARDYITLSGQDIVRGVVDVSDDTNLTADGTEIVLTGDALSLGTALTYTTGTSSTSFYTGLLGVNSEYFSDLTGTGLQNSSGVLTLNATGDWTGTLDGFDGADFEQNLTAGDGLTRTVNDFDCDTASGSMFGCLSSADWTTFNNKGQSNWAYNGSRLSPSTTVGIGVFASSTIGDGTATGGLTVNGSATSTGTTTARNLVVGNYGMTAQSGIVEAAGWINASTSGRSGIIYQNYGGGTAPEFRFTIGDPFATLEYLSLGLTNSNAVTPGTIYGVNKADLVYIISNSGRDMAIGSGAGDLHLGTNSSVAGLIQLDHSTQNVLIGATATATPSYKLTVVGDIGMANLVATGTATSVNMIATSILRAPYGSAPTVVTNGDMGVDSTSNQFKYQSGGVTKVLGDGNVYPAFTYSTSTAWTGTTTIPLGPAFVAETWNAVRCFTDTGTVNVDFGDGTNFMNATTSKAVNPAPSHTLSTNNTFTAGETRYARVGTPVSSPTSISCTVSKSLTAD